MHMIDEEISQQQDINVDMHEMAIFSSIAHSWWDMEGASKLLHRINPLRLDYILNRSMGLFGKIVLDVGCGGGILSESMAREGAEVTGLDICEEVLMIARLHAMEQDLSIQYLHQTVEEHAKHHSETYDIVTCMEMLEHVPDPYGIIRACAHLVKPGGEVFFSTLNRNLKSWLILIIGVECILKLLPYGTHNIDKFITPAELIDWICKTSLCEQHIIGVHYNPVLDRFTLSNNIDVNYILHTIKPNNR